MPHLRSAALPIALLSCPFFIACSMVVTLVPSTSSAAITFGPDFADLYTDVSLGTPTGVPGPLGGLTLLSGDPNTLLIGGNANNYGGQPGAIYSIGLTRGAGNHISGFKGTAALYADAPYIDGGLAYGPGNALFFTEFPWNVIGQIKSGSSVPDRVDLINGVGGNGNSVGSLAFIPPGFGGAGSLKVLTFQGASFGTIPLTADGGGTFNLGTATLNAILSGGPEGFAYVKSGNAGFAFDSMLVSEYTSGKVGSYEVDANGNPIAGTRRDFITNLTNAEGAFIDPLTGDFLFSTFFSDNEVFVVQGFTPPSGEMPEPASIFTWVVMSLSSAVVAPRRMRK